MTNENKDKIREVLTRVKNGLRITKVVATRSVKSPRGDHFVGFSAQFDSVQDDASGPGADMVDVGGDNAIPLGAMSLKEARVACALLQMQADIAAVEGACAGGDISKDRRDGEVSNIRRSFAALVASIVGD
jgi:hypothetical protein